jgi:hypothetical protein
MEKISIEENHGVRSRLGLLRVWKSTMPAVPELFPAEQIGATVDVAFGGLLWDSCDALVRRTSLP